MTGGTGGARVETATGSHSAEAAAGPVNTARFWTERGLLAAVVGAYLWLLSTDAPNGDGWVYINSVQSGQFDWNPNHLYMQPVGLLAYRLVSALGLGWSVFTTLKVLSGLAAVATVVLFHATLCVAGVRSPAVRLLGCLGLLFSAQFISLAVAEEFFAIQMPVLAAVLLTAVLWIQGRERRWLVAMGLLLASVTLIQVNNAVLAALMGLFVASESRRSQGPWVRDGLAVWLPGLLVGLPLILGPYVATAYGEGLMSWLTSYQGQSGNDRSALYGITLTPAGIARSAGALVYGFALTFVGLGDLGTVVEALVLRQPIEFTPNVPLLVATGLLFAVIAAGTLAMTLWWWRRGRHEAVGRLGLVWLVAYLIFNFLWVDTADQFWAPILPPLWLLIVRRLSNRQDGPPPVGAAVPRYPVASLAALTVLLAAVNTPTVGGVRAFTQVEANHAALLKLLQAGDLYITMGWDDIAWLALPEGRPYERLSLMPLALRGRDDSPEMKALPDRIRAHLATGKRVVIARVFVRDREARPWEQMARLGWPRPRVIDLFAPFDPQPLGQVGSVHLHVIQPPRPAGGEAGEARP